MSDPSPIDTKAIAAQVLWAMDIWDCETNRAPIVEALRPLCDSLDAAIARIAELEAALREIMAPDGWTKCARLARKALEGKSNV